MIKNELSIPQVEELFKDLISSACADGKEYLKSMPHSLDTLIVACRRWPEYLYEQSDFALSILRKYLNERERVWLANNYLYVDYKVDANIEKIPRIYFLGSSSGEIRTEDYAVSTIYLFNQSKITLRAGLNSILAVETFDDACLHIENGEKSKIRVYKHDRSVVTGVARIKFEEYKRESDRQ